ncbi:hypothetical protein SAMN04487995_0449 [Dyadobacter koreensis]|uniref:Uncharacterized protein n=1 Tax=Dyadobacter koreensis TaxID=408657 RepID=A0A1H6QA22_9BACT|nr:hypothetical protein [Dyadobacter koreensis]SEI40641.1 hypothetical protein SAMN04487995_0449 [Dyadobacter koreensis]
MKTELAPSNIKETSIGGLRTGDFIVNLGEVLEIDELTNAYSVVVRRSNQKQVFTFDKEDLLLVKKKNN